MSTYHIFENFNKMCVNWVVADQTVVILYKQLFSKKKFAIKDALFIIKVKDLKRHL